MAILKEIDSLPPCYHGEVVDFIGYIKGKIIKESISIEKAAEAAAEECCSNKDLAACSDLDGEGSY